MSSPHTDTSSTTKPFKRLEQLELLATLVLLQVVQSFLSDNGILQRGIFNFLFLAIVLSAIRTFSGSQVIMVTALSFGGLAFTISWISEFSRSLVWVTSTYLCYIVVFSLLLVSLCERVFGDGPVDPNRIIGSVSIYFVLGLIWAMIYSALETLRPGSFALPAELSDEGIRQGLVGELIYFSNVTLTTLGYGDIVPRSKPARMFASIEAIVGQLYVAIVIARLVGLQIAERRT